MTLPGFKERDDKSMHAMHISFSASDRSFIVEDNHNITV